MRALLRRVFCREPSTASVPLELVRARHLIAALDAGGIPLDPGRIKRIAEDLGLEVSRNARMEDTIERIRAALKRC